MILGDPAPAAAGRAHGLNRLTLDEVLRHRAQQCPDALALVDAANRASFADGEPRRLTYAEADRSIAAIAGRLRQMGLPTDSVIGIQLPNIVENILVMLGVLRAAMIPAPLPLLWRRADAVAALARVGAKALVTCSRVGAFDHGQFAIHVAAEVFSIRYVCAFGKNLPDGVVSFDDLLAAARTEPAPPDRERQNGSTAHIAAVTFDSGEGGPVAVARNHAELFAGGLAVLLESGLAQNSNVLSTLAPSSFAGICLTLVPWLLSGGTLVLHHAFDPAVLARQRRSDRCATLVLPAPAAFLLAEMGGFAVGEPASIIAAWRAPERLALSPPWREPNTLFVDVSIFGEAALVPARRNSDGRPSPIPLGPIIAPRAGAGGIVVGELVRSDAGSVAVRGPMVPYHAFPPGIEQSGLPYFKIGHGGLVDSGYPCRIDSITNAVVVTAPPPGTVSVGGYRFPLRDLRDIVGRIDSAATLAALPDPVVGQRLIGNAADRDAMQAALAAAGANPIVVGAFRERKPTTLRDAHPPAAEP